MGIRELKKMGLFSLDPKKVALLLKVKLRGLKIRHYTLRMTAWALELLSTNIRAECKQSNDSFWFRMESQGPGSKSLVTKT